MKKETPLVCLPTDKASNLSKVFNDFVFGIELYPKVPAEEKEDCVNQFLYALSDEPIKEGDWFIHNSHGVSNVYKAEKIIGKSIVVNNGRSSCWLEYSKKIIGTNNPELWKDGYHYNEEKEHEYTLDKGIPKLPLSLIEHYAKYQPDSVMLEYENCSLCRGTKEYSYGGSFGGAVKTQRCTCIDKLKLTPSGEVIWSPMKQNEEHPRDKVVNSFDRFLSEVDKLSEHPRAESPVEEKTDEIEALKEQVAFHQERYRKLLKEGFVPNEHPRAEVDVEKLVDEYIRKDEYFDEEGISEYQNGKKCGFRDGYNQALQQRAEVKEESWDEIYDRFFKVKPSSIKLTLKKFLKLNYHPPLDKFIHHSPKPKNK